MFFGFFKTKKQELGKGGIRRHFKQFDDETQPQKTEKHAVAVTCDKVAVNPIHKTASTTKTSDPNESYNTNSLMNLSQTLANNIIF